VDLAAWWAGKRWVALLELIDMLPAASRFNEAVANDPEAAAALAQAKLQEPEGETSDWAPRVTEYDLHAMLLRELLHAVKGLRQVSIAAAGGNPGQEQPFPGPRTALEKALDEAERSWAAEFVQQLGFDPEDI
jgi:hypothetical protein